MLMAFTAVAYTGSLTSSLAVSAATTEGSISTATDGTSTAPESSEAATTGCPYGKKKVCKEVRVYDHYKRKYVYKKVCKCVPVNNNDDDDDDGGDDDDDGGDDDDDE